MAKFRSTRGEADVSFSEALFNGLAPDGGLYVPSDIPRVDFREVFAQPDFPSAGNVVLRQWLTDDIAADALGAIIRDAFDFPVPIVTVGADVHVLELFHGPTLSFKDFGARLMARWMGHFLQERKEDVTILVATSGDTGSAVADGFADQERIRVVLLYPKGKVSPVQERQLIVKRHGVKALAVAGDFDDCQRIVKEAFVDPSLVETNLSSANSINIGRLLPQMLYYIWAARELDEEGTPLFCVPSGNLGNLSGGVLAYLSGLPVRGFVAAHNVNDFFPRFLSGEDASFAATRPTFSNAMDVGAPSNFERLRALLSPGEMRRLIRGASVSDPDTLASMRRVYEETGYLADPHTAVGLEAARRMRLAEEGPVVALSTAHPGKFPEVVREAVGFEPETPRRLSDLWRREIEVETIEPKVDALREVLRR
jgi:threonine synthase